MSSPSLAPALRAARRALRLRLEAALASLFRRLADEKAPGAAALWLEEEAEGFSIRALAPPRAARLP